MDRVIVLSVPPAALFMCVELEWVGAAVAWLLFLLLFRGCLGCVNRESNASCSSADAAVVGSCWEDVLLCRDRARSEEETARPNVTFSLSLGSSS